MSAQVAFATAVATCADDPHLHSGCRHGVHRVGRSFQVPRRPGPGLAPRRPSCRLQGDPRSPRRRTTTAGRPSWLMVSLSSSISPPLDGDLLGEVRPARRAVSLRYFADLGRQIAWPRSSPSPEVAPDALGVGTVACPPAGLGAELRGPGSPRRRTGQLVDHRVMGRGVRRRALRPAGYSGRGRRGPPLPATARMAPSWTSSSAVTPVSTAPTWCASSVDGGASSA